MSQLVFLPGFDGRAQLRREFLDALAPRHEVRAVSYPNRALGSLDAYREHAMGEVPVDWRPVLVADLDDEVVAERLRLIASEDVSAQFQALRIPTIVVHFAPDNVIGPHARAHLEAACRNPRVVRLEGPHFAIATRPLECAAAISASLA